MLINSGNVQALNDDKSVNKIKEISVVMDDNYPPYIFKDSNGIYQGILVDQWKLWEEKTKIKVAIVPETWNNALSDMAQGKYDVIDTLFYNEERSKIYDYSKSYTKIDVPIYFITNITGINNAESLKSFNVAVKSGDSCIAYLQARGINNFTFYNSYEEIVLAAKANKVAIFVADAPPIKYFLYKDGIQDEFNFSKPLYTGEFHRAVKKGNRELLTVIESGFAMISSNEYKDIDRKWLGTPIRNTKYFKNIFYILGSVFIFVIILIMWNFTLKRRVNKKTAELKAANLMLAESEEKYRFLTENASDVIWKYNLTQNKFTYVSPSIFHMRGVTAEEGVNEKIEDIMTKDSLEIVNGLISVVVNELKNNPDTYINNVVEIQQICKDGRIIWVEISTRMHFSDNKEIEVVGISRDITDRKKANEEILYLSNHDQLTSLYNRRFYEEELIKLNTEANLPLTIIMGDVNGLKLINDSFGHQLGDELLRKVAEVINKGCRPQDIIARLGGDEFIILLPKTEASTAETIITNMKKLALKEKVGSIDVSISFGYDTKVDVNENIDEIFKNTEDYMYRHKLSESTSMRSKTIDLIMNTLYEKNNREMLHSKRVSELCEAIAEKVGFDKDGANQIRLAGLMHDIGKIVIDENILNKPGRLNHEEWMEMKRHTEIGFRILSSTNEFSEIANFVLEHHENLDGSGYPRGLNGSDISLQGKIICIADAFDAMTSYRTYGTILSEDEAVKELLQNSGTQFDPVLVKIFIEGVLGKKMPV